MTNKQTTKEKIAEMLELAMEMTEKPTVYKNRVKSAKLDLALDILNYLSGYDDKLPSFFEDAN